MVLAMKVVSGGRFRLYSEEKANWIYATLVWKKKLSKRWLYSFWFKGQGKKQCYHFLRWAGLWKSKFERRWKQKEIHYFQTYIIQLQKFATFEGTHELSRIFRVSHRCPWLHATEFEINKKKIGRTSWFGDKKSNLYKWFMCQRESCNENYKIFRFIYKCKRAVSHTASHDKYIYIYIYECALQPWHNNKNLEMTTCTGMTKWH